MNAAGLTTEAAQEFRAICGAEHVTEDPAVLHHRLILGITPALEVQPGSADEVAEILGVANDRGLTVVPAGGFTQQHTGNLVPQIDVLLSTSRLTGVEHYDAGDLTVGVGAGCTVAQLSALVAADRLLFAIDPPQPGRCTIGGVLATAAHGALRHGYGGVRDFCIGIRFVTGDGRKAKGGGRVVKNVAGYDLMKLLIGSQGTLAVITSASFKLFPAPRQTLTFVAEFGSPSDALAFRNRILKSPLSPACLELVSPGARDILRPEAPHSDAWSVCVRASGSDAVLARYRVELGDDVTRQVDGEDESNVWTALANYSETFCTANPRSLLLSLTMPIKEVLSVVDVLAKSAEAYGFRAGFIGRIGAGHVQAGLWPKSESELTLVNFVNAVSAVRSALPRDTSMVIDYCPPEARHHVNVWGPTPTDIESMRAVKNALDPRDVLNRGRFLF